MVTPVKYDLVREDGRLERVCAHGIGHTVGHITGKSLGRWGYVHGCDGCCKDYEMQEEPEESRHE